MARGGGPAPNSSVCSLRQRDRITTVRYFFCWSEPPGRLCITLPGQNGGITGVLVYLFRDESGCDRFAYSTDVTGRNLPLTTERTKWSFVAAMADRDIEAFEDVVPRLRRRGFHLFRK